MTKTIEFTVKNSNPFTSYLKKFASIDKSVLFELDLENSQFVAKSSNEERSIVKHCILSFSESGFELNTKSKLRIKIGIYNISRLIKIMEQFGTEFQFIVKYDEKITNNNEKDYAATSIVLTNKDLKFNNECTSLNIFKYISDDLYKEKICKIDGIISCDLSKETIEKIRALCELDKEFKLLDFVNKEGKLFARGKSFEFLIVNTSNIENRISFYKDQFDKVDIENYKVSIGSDRMLLTSNDTLSEIVISKVEVNENYEETNDTTF